MNRYDLIEQIESIEIINKIEEISAQADEFDHDLKGLFNYPRSRMLISAVVGKAFVIHGETVEQYIKWLTDNTDLTSELTASYDSLGVGKMTEYSWEQGCYRVVRRPKVGKKEMFELQYLLRTATAYVTLEYNDDSKLEIKHSCSYEYREEKPTNMSKAKITRKARHLNQNYIKTFITEASNYLVMQACFD